MLVKFHLNTISDIIKLKSRSSSSTLLFKLELTIKLLCLSAKDFDSISIFDSPLFTKCSMRLSLCRIFIDDSESDGLKILIFIVAKSSLHEYLREKSLAHHLSS